MQERSARTRRDDWRCKNTWLRGENEKKFWFKGIKFVYFILGGALRKHGTGRKAPQMKPNTRQLLKLPRVSNIELSNTFSRPCNPDLHYSSVHLRCCCSTLTRCTSYYTFYTCPLPCKPITSTSSSSSF